MQQGRRWLLALTFSLAACQAVPSAAPGPAAKDPAAGAAEALERGEYAKAADLFRTALASAPERMSLHYGLGVSASYLERRNEAIREFRWVLEHGPQASEEARAARRWLESVGALPQTTTMAPTSPTEELQEPASKPASASLRGRVVFGENPHDVVPLSRAQLFLWDHPKRARYFSVRTDEEGRFQFTNLAPGTYRLSDRIAGPPRWRLRLDLNAGQDMNLDLVPDNSTRVRDDFPDTIKG